VNFYRVKPNLKRMFLSILVAVNSHFYMLCRVSICIFAATINQEKHE